MTTIARIGYGTTVSFSTFSGEITGVDISSEKDQHEVTHMDSPSDANGNGFKEFIAGMRDPGELTLQLNFNATQDDPQSLGSDTLTITWPDGSTFEWDAAECTGYDVSAEPNSPMTATATWKLSGALTQTAA